MSLNNQQINVEGLSIKVLRKNIKAIRLSIYPPDGHIKISVPLKVKEDYVRLFISSKMSWIKKQQLKFSRKTQLPQRKYISGETCYFEGQAYLLTLIYHQKTAKILLRNTTHLELYVKKNSSTENRKNILIEWYRGQLKKRLPDLIAKWQPIIGVTVKDWGVKRMKTRWGTCNVADARIWLNLELMTKPTHCLEYVVVHEMVHLLERSHNARFKAYMDKFLPEWRSYEQALNQSTGSF